MTAPQLLSVADVAAVLSCSRDHVYDLVAAGHLPKVDIAIKRDGRPRRPKTRIPANAVERFIATGGTRSADR